MNATTMFCDFFFIFIVLHSFFLVFMVVFFPFLLGADLFVLFAWFFKQTPGEYGLLLKILFYIGATIEQLWNKETNFVVCRAT